MFLEIGVVRSPLPYGGAARRVATPSVPTICLFGASIILSAPQNAHDTLSATPVEVVLIVRIAGSSWVRLCFTCLSLLLAPLQAHAQGSDIDILRGRIVASDSTPIVNANVRVTSMMSQAVRQVRTDDRGRFQLVFQNGGGDFIVAVTSIGVAPVEVRIRREGDEDFLLVNLVMRKIQALPTLMVTERDRPKGELVPTEVGAAAGQVNAAIIPPELQGDLNALAATLSGMQLTYNADGTIAGFSALGLDASQNAMTLNGMRMTGSGLPRDAAVVTQVNTTSFDASKGRFSGAQVSSFAMSGGPIQQHSVRFSFDDPALQYNDPVTRSLPQQSRNLQISGNHSGEFVKDRSTYNVSYQLGQRARALNTLLDADSVALSRLGLTRDSVARFIDILQTIGVPYAIAGIPTDRRDQNASIFGRLDYNPSNGGSFSTTFSGGWNGSDANSLSNRAPASYGGRSRSWNGNVQASYNAPIGAMFLNEFQVQMTRSANHGDPYLTLPAASVLVSSLGIDGGTAASALQFGSASGLYSDATSGEIGLSNNLSWFNGSSRHRLKFNLEVDYEWYRQLQSGNAQGTFSYNSLADLETGRPASFVRRIGAQERTGDAISGGLSITDTWRKTNALQFQLGARLDGLTYPTRPQYNPDLDRLLGLRTDHAPQVFTVSPRFGFSWNVGKAPAAVGSNFGPGVFGTFRGGLGRFVNTPGANYLTGAIDATGLPGGAQQLTCLGSSVPDVDWRAVLRDPSLIPSTCADGTGASPFTVNTPRVTTFSPTWSPSAAWRANVGWSSYLTSRFRANVDVQYSINTHQASSVDLNFDPTSRFTLPAEGGRPVFVSTSDIVPASGAVSLISSRRTASYSQVMSSMGDGESRSLSLTLGLSPVQRSFSINPTSWNLSWTTVAVHERVRGFGANPSGNPSLFDWSRGGGDIAHQINANIRKGFGTEWNVQLNMRAQSGSPFTPTVGGDVNGDGRSSDPAFVFDPAVTTDSAVQAGMRTLLANAPAGIRSCLARQLGKVVERNSCRGPWSASFSLGVLWTPRNSLWGDRARINFNFQNPLTGLDALWHRGRLEGWGQPGFADPTLLNVRGFDPTQQRFVYEVNQRFGETRGTRSLPAQPFRATVDIRFTLGPSIERQQARIELQNWRRPGGPTPTVQTISQRNVTQAAANLRPVLAQKDSIGLSKVQVDSVNALITTLTKRAEALWTPTAEYILKLNTTDADAELVQKLKDTRAAVLDAQFTAYRALRNLLTPEQRKKLKPPMSFMIEEDYMKSIKLQGAGTTMGFQG